MAAHNTEHEAEKEAARMWSFVIALGALVVTLLAGRWLEKRHIHWMPHSGVGVLVGALCAGVLRWESGFSTTHLDDDVLKDERFSNDVFMTLLLPPIIFDAGFNIDAPSAMRNLGPSTFFAFIGTTFSTAVVGLLCYGAGQFGLCYPLGLLPALTFGSLISATDPVSVLSVFQALGVQDDVFAIVFGESVLNDAVAIVLTRTLLAFNTAPTAATAELTLSGRIIRACIVFIIEFASSLLIGALFGGSLALLLHKLGMRERSRAPSATDAATELPSDDLVLTVALCFAFPWASYYTAEALECSGIVTLLFCGMVMAQYAKPHMSPAASRVASSAFKCAGFVAETGVFIYLGEAVFSFPILAHTTWKLVVVAMLACALGRLHVPIGVWLTNAYRGGGADAPLPNAELRDDAPLAHLSSGVSMVIWWSGLRGGVAFALASAIFAHRDFDQHCGGLARDAVGASHYHGWSRHCSEGPRTKHSMTDGLAILQVTLLIATCSIFFLGGTIKRVSEACGVVKGHRDGDALVLVRPADRPLVKRPSRTRLLVPTAAVPTDEGL